MFLVRVLGSPGRAWEGVPSREGYQGKLCLQGSCPWKQLEFRPAEESREMMSCITLELSALQISCHLPKSQKEPIQYWNPVVTLCFFSVCYMGVNPQDALSQEPWNKG